MILLRVDLRGAAADDAKYEELKQRQSVVWGTGPYQRITETLDDIQTQKWFALRFTGDEGVTIDAVRGIALAALDATGKDTGILVVRVSEWRASRLRIKMA